jgi:bifunctional enzyme CysN/CysC
LRIVTCGSVDDGKSTLIGRLLYEHGAIAEDQLAALERDSKRFGTRGNQIDFALLVDGLMAEREQGITIDVAYRYFETTTHKIILADSPGHEQYTRNMATAASHADVAVILIDARKGVLAQTRRHTTILSLMGIERVVVAVNKMDCIDHDLTRFAAIQNEFNAYVKNFAFKSVLCVPVVAPDGNGIVRFSGALQAHTGPTLMSALLIDPSSPTVSHAAIMPVQWVQRPHADFRGFSGTLLGGPLQLKQNITIYPSRQTAQIKQMWVADKEADRALPYQAVTLTLDREVDISRGNVIANSQAPVEIGSQFDVTIIWMHEAPLLQGRQYWLKSNHQTVLATISPIKYKLNVDTNKEEPAERLELNDIGQAEIVTDRPLVFAPFTTVASLGAFILIDRITQETVGAGMIRYALRRSANVHWQQLSINRDVRARQKNQRGAVLWFTGLSGSGKSTIADLLDKRLVALGHHTFLLDGDNVRHGLNKDLGFTDQDRVENIRRIAEVAKLMSDAGLITLVSFISPFASERRMARSLCPANEFFEIFIDTPLSETEKRDPKGLYKKARAGQIKNFTGLDSPYERPIHPELRLDTTQLSVEQSVEQILTCLVNAKVLMP